MIKLIKPRPLRLKSSSSLDLERIKEITNLTDEKAKKVKDFLESIFSKMKRDDNHRLKSKFYPDSIFYTVEDKIYFELDSKYEWTWVRYQDFWEKFQSEFGLNYNKTKKLIHDTLEQHLKCKVFPTQQSVFLQEKVGTTLKM